jgi:hypothetical protein
MGFMRVKSLFLFLSFVIFPVFGNAKADYDVNDVLIKGDSTLMNMRIKSVHFADGAFFVETTGARFEYEKGQLKLYQGLDEVNRRLLSTITFDNEPNFVKVEDNNDHILFWSKDLNLGMYGDSTLIIFPKSNQRLKCLGKFKPDYEGRYKGEVLLIDDKGGMEIYPQRYEAGYKISQIELGKIDWIADYELNVGERVMIAAFPGRPFDWEKSFQSNVMFVHGYPVQLKHILKTNFMKNVSDIFNVVAIWHAGFYKANKYGSWVGPYVVAEPGLFKIFVRSAHRKRLKVMVYCSYVYHYDQYKDPELFFDEIKDLKTNFDIDGVYIDGMRCDIAPKKLDDKIDNWEMLRRLRELFGSDGYIMLHGTALGTPVGTSPPVDSYCDSVLNGENIPFQSLDDPYVKYHVRKYGISNTVALWKPGSHPESISDRAILDALLAMQGRERYWFDGSFDSYRQLSPDYRYYLEQLNKLENTLPQ